MKKISLYFHIYDIEFQYYFCKWTFCSIKYNKSINSDSIQLDRDNPFLRNSSFNTMHKVEAGDSLVV